MLVLLGVPDERWSSGESSRVMLERHTQSANNLRIEFSFSLSLSAERPILIPKIVSKLAIENHHCINSGRAGKKREREEISSAK